MSDNENPRNLSDEELEELDKRYEEIREEIKRRRELNKQKPTVSQPASQKP